VHLQQTKNASRATGGPQYYFHGVPETVKDFLRRKGACPVVLQTPYGIFRSSFMAVGRDHKLAANGRIVPGKVGHDRIQQASGEESIGEAIRHWYGLSVGRDFERIEVDVTIHHEGHFILIPTAATMRGAKRSLKLEKLPSPLSFHHDHQSKLWRRQIEDRSRVAGRDVAWAESQLRRLVQEQRHSHVRNIHEADLLRASGALAMLGVHLSPYLVQGYDCPQSTFEFLGLPAYPCPVEIKKRSSRFNYQIMRYAQLPRVVVLCVEHDLVNPPDHIDVVELSALAEYLAA
jgi:hypothetical protein